MTERKMRTIKGLRSDVGLTQADLAKKLDVSRQTVAYWEEKQPYLSGEVVLKLVDFFNISADDLLGTK